MLRSRKHVFWEALVITVTLFLMGLFFGMLLETSNSQKVSQLYVKSEISLVDGLATTIIADDRRVDCDVLKENNVRFADQVYEEALLLEDYEASESLTDSTALLRKKYDLLRTLLWRSNADAVSRCDNFLVVVYLYESLSEDLELKARQNVWSRILLEVKQDHPDVLLLPIGVDRNLTSLNLLLDEYGVYQFPALIIDNEEVVYELDSVSEFEERFIR